MTGEDLSVLVVDPAGASEELCEQLEFLNVAVEQSRPEDLEAVLPLVEPDLVVHYGSGDLEGSLEVLRKLNPDAPTRLLIIAARDQLPELRKLDRKIVVSLVATDISAKFIASRVAMLAKKCQAGEAALGKQRKTVARAEGQEDEDTVDLHFVGAITASTPPPEALPAQAGSQIVVGFDTKAPRQELHPSTFSDEQGSPTERTRSSPEKIGSPPHPSTFPFPQKSTHSPDDAPNVWVLGLVVASFAACGLWFLVRPEATGEVSPIAPTDSSPASQADLKAEPTAPPDAADKAKSGGDDGPGSTDPENLWVTPARKKLAGCDELITDKETLMSRGMAQAKLSWSEANTALMRGELDRAQLLLCEAVTIHPESLAWEGLIDLAITQGTPESASLWVSRALALRGERSRTLLLVGDIQSQLGQVQKALSTWARALGVAPTDTKTLRRVGAQYRAEATGKLKSGDFANAERLLRRAGTLDPTDPLALAGLAECRWALKDTTHAKAWAQQALSLDSGQPEALVVLADIQLANKQMIEAKRLYEKALERAPSHKHARLQLHKISLLPSPSAESTHTKP